MSIKNLIAILLPGKDSMPSSEGVDLKKLLQNSADSSEINKT